MGAVSGRWQDRALCQEGASLAIPFAAGVVAFVPFDSGWWFPDRQGDPALPAKRVCAACPVREECLADALERGEEFGIWGGAGENTRRALRMIDDPERRADAVARHFVRLDHLAAVGVPGPSDGSGLVSFGDGAQCGTAAKYGRGCHCPRCTEAKRVDQLRRRRRKRFEVREEGRAS